jgi:hypothetical protein
LARCRHAVVCAARQGAAQSRTSGRCVNTGLQSGIFADLSYRLGNIR